MRNLLFSVLMLLPVLVFAEGVPEAADTTAGKAVYSQTCIACHGADGKGAIPGVTDFTAKDGPLSKSDAELVKNISEGFQTPGSFMAMPAKGGNPALTEADIRAVLAYLLVEFGGQ
jgi:mono/diheme cytochrome c family protein